MRMRIKPENGQKVVAKVKVGLYEARGEYQLVVEAMEDAGVGQLQRAFEELKKKLTEQGLFDQERKRDLPEHPKRIGVITSPTGAAVQDIINVLKRRAPHIPILIYAAAVQGEQSTPELIKAIKQANHDKKCDVLLLTRGGGSIEDLWSFNDETLANTIYNSEIPIVTGVGHEIDFTIADFVSDQRAPTPSAAAELISPERDVLLGGVNYYAAQLEKLLLEQIHRHTEKLAMLQKRLQIRDPRKQLQNHAQRIDELEIRLKQVLKMQMQQRSHKLHNVTSRLANRSPDRHIQREAQRIKVLQTRLLQNMTNVTRQKSAQLSIASAKLNALSPLSTLERGFGIARKDNKVVKSVSQLQGGDKINLTLADGQIDCTVDASLKNLL